MVDELQPAVSQIEPLLKQATVAIEALSADLIEVNGVLRDVSAVSGAASSASSAVTGLADAASEKVHKLFAKPRKTESVPVRPHFGDTADAPSAETLDRSSDLEPAVPEAARDRSRCEADDAPVSTSPTPPPRRPIMSNPTRVALTVACEPHLARIVRMTAANVATLSADVR